MLTPWGRACSNLCLFCVCLTVCSVLMLCCHVRTTAQGSSGRQEAQGGGEEGAGKPLQEGRAVFQQRHTEEADSRWVGGEFHRYTRGALG